MYEYDKRVVLTLDAGGTNFVFSAIQGNNEMISPRSEERRVGKECRSRWSPYH